MYCLGCDKVLGTLSLPDKEYETRPVQRSDHIYQVGNELYQKHIKESGCPNGWGHKPIKEK